MGQSLEDQIREIMTRLQEAETSALREALEARSSDKRGKFLDTHTRLSYMRMNCENIVNPPKLDAELSQYEQQQQAQGMRNMNTAQVKPERNRF